MFYHKTPEKKGKPQVSQDTTKLSGPKKQPKPSTNFVIGSNVRRKLVF